MVGSSPPRWPPVSPTFWCCQVLNLSLLIALLLCLYAFISLPPSSHISVFLHPSVSPFPTAYLIISPPLFLSLSLHSFFTLLNLSISPSLSLCLCPSYPYLSFHPSLLPLFLPFFLLHFPLLFLMYFSLFLFFFFILHPLSLLILFCPFLLKDTYLQTWDITKILRSV